MPLTRAQQDEIRNLVASGDRIAAVKRFRELTGAGLNEALQAVNRLAFGASDEPAFLTSMTKPGPAAPPSAKATRAAEVAAMAAIRAGSTLDAVKAYRQHTGLGLMDAKNAIDILTLVHHSNERVGPSVAKAVIAAVSAGRKNDAVNELMMRAGFDEPEARAFIQNMASLGIARIGCARMVAFAAGLAGLLFALAVLKLAGLIWSPPPQRSGAGGHEPERAIATPRRRRGSLPATPVLTNYA